MHDFWNKMIKVTVTTVHNMTLKTKMKHSNWGAWELFTVHGFWLVVPNKFNSKQFGNT